eukprot:gene12133-16197_t
MISGTDYTYGIMRGSTPPAGEGMNDRQQKDAAMPPEPSAEEAHAQQAAYWNGPGAEMWVTRQARMDAALAPVTRALLARSRRRVRVLDVGCGTGVLAVAAARTGSRRAVGTDIDRPSVRIANENAKENAATARFVHASGLNHRLVRQDAPYDLAHQPVVQAGGVDEAGG